MLGGNYHIGRSEERVGTGCVNNQFLLKLIHLKPDLGSFRTPNPGFLLTLGRVGPIQILQSGQQFFGISRDSEDDLPEVSPFDGMSAPPDWFFVHIGKATLKELEENPLGPLVVARVSGIDFPVPVDGEADALDLPPEILHVGLRSDGGMGARLDGVLLGRKPEGIPSHRVEDVETKGLTITG